MGSEIHLIEKQKVYFDFASEEKAKSWNQHATTFYYDEILPILNQVFNANVPDDKWYLLNYFEIDLGEIRTDDVKSALLRTVEKKLSEILANQRIRKKNVNTHRSTASNVPALSSGLPDGVTLKGPHDRLLDLFLNFLDYGMLKWKTPFNSMEEMQDAIMKQVSVGELIRRQEFTDRMNILFIRKRLSYQFSKSFTVPILHAVFSNEIKIIEAFRRLMDLRIGRISKDLPAIKFVSDIISEDALIWITTADTDRRENLPMAVIHTVIDRMISSRDADGNPAIPRSIIIKLLFDKRGNDSTQFRRVIEIIESSSYYDAIGTGSGKVTQRDNVKKGKGKDRSIGNALLASSCPPAETGRFSAAGTTNEGALDNLNSELSIDPITSSSRPAGNEILYVAKTEGEANLRRRSSLLNREAGAADTDENLDVPSLRKEGAAAFTEYYTQNAGVILCWPYLNQLFTRCGYLYLTNFRDMKAKERAVHMLGYIATGHDRCPEYQLTLPKFLTGWPMQMPVMKELKMFKKEKKEADGMLKSLIVNWSILKNTSIEGLRSSFFQRDGKLIRQENGWKLIVEQKSFDMLLDHLPYSLSLVKLPWNKDVLRVDWA